MSSKVKAEVRASLFALAAGLLVAVLLIVISTPRPGRMLRAFFLQPFSNSYFLGNMLSSAGYLLIAALGVIVAFRAGLFNLGGDGQIYIGALAGTIVGLAVPGLPGIVGAALVLLVAAVTSALLSAIAGVLKHLFDAPELITSYLLSAALATTATWYITGPGRDRAGNLLATRAVAESYRLSRFLPPSELNTSILWAIVLAAGLSLFLFRTVRGYELRTFGTNREFAVYAGMPAAALTIGAMTASGALHGLTGGLMVLGTYHAAISGFSFGVGWNAIAVALVARLHPLAAIGSALVFSFLSAGAQSAMLQSPFTFELGAIIQAVILLLVTAQFSFPRLRERLKRAAAGPEIP
jgi:ABC-type uncharacterized transport system permease subunit